MSKTNMTRVLIVDDSTFMRSTLNSFMEEQGYEVVGLAKNGEMAIDLALELNPDIITLDNILPDMTGINVLKALAANEISSTVIMLSAVGQQSSIVEAKELGAKEYIVKPYDKQHLSETMMKYAR